MTIFLNKVRLCAVVISVVITTLGCSTITFSKEKPTAIVVDSVTGEPIEGAVALAIWRKYTSKRTPFWEGGNYENVRVEEAVSDKNGHIYIDGFWDWFSKPHLTVYKFGYVCWDQFGFYHKTGTRKDFKSRKRVVKLEKWPDDFSYARHSMYINSVTKNYRPPGSLFEEEYQKEVPLVLKELKRNREN